LRPARTRSSASAAAIAAVAACLFAADAAPHAIHTPPLGASSIQAEIAAADREQAHHEFAAARERLDRVIATDSRNVQARLMRASIAILLGEFAPARRDCTSVIDTGLALPGTICLAGAMTGPGSLARAKQLLAALEGVAPAAAEIESWRLVTAADLAVRDADPASALALLERAHDVAPGDEEVRTRFAALLLDRGQALRALDLASTPGASLARAIVGARAARALGHPDAARLLQEAEGLLRSSGHDRESAHDREAALVALHLADDADLALCHARRNFELQKDTADVRVLLESALAAGDAAGIAAVREWLRVSGFQDRVVEERLLGAP
jgi:hypothetical protein